MARRNYAPSAPNPIWSLFIFVVTLLVVGAGVYVLLNFERYQPRLAAISQHAETTWRRIQPKPALPTPPSQSAIDPLALLRATAPVPATTPTPSQPTPPPTATPTVVTDEVGFAAATATPVSAQVALVEVAVETISGSRPPQVMLEGVRHEWQTWNNCGPSTVAMALSYYDDPGTQVEAAAFLKPNEDDKNVSPHELLAYARSVGFDGFIGVGGSLDLLKDFLAAGYPVVVEFWTERDDNGGMGHYRLLTGYDEAAQTFNAYDSLLGANITVSMTAFDADWQVFNRIYLLFFPSERAATAYTLAGFSADPNQMYAVAQEIAQAEAAADPENAFAWFNLGTNYARQGQATQAASAFDQARRLGLPYRMLWYQFEIFEVYLAEGRHQEVVDLTTATLQATGGLEELYFYRGLAYEALNQGEAATQDFEAALIYNPNFSPAQRELNN